MAIDNFQIASWGWFKNPAVAQVPSGEEIHSLGWLEGVVTPVITTAEGRLFAIQFWPIIPKRFKFAR